MTTKQLFTVEGAECGPYEALPVSDNWWTYGPISVTRATAEQIVEDLNVRDAGCGLTAEWTGEDLLFTWGEPFVDMEDERIAPDADGRYLIGGLWPWIEVKVEQATAAQELRAALAPYGLTVHDIEDYLIGGCVLSWLTLVSGDTTEDPGWGQPHLNVYLVDPDDGDEVNVHRPTRENDCWIVELNDGIEQWVQDRYFPVLETAAVAAHLAEWHRSTRPAGTAA